MSFETPEQRAELEAAVRRYLRSVARRYTGAACVAIALVLVIVLIPSKAPRAVNTATSASGDGPTVAVPTGEPQAGGAVSGPGSPLGIGASPVTGGSAPLPGAASSTGGGSAPAQQPVTAGRPGIARSGVRCGPGVKQVTWLSYAPPCMPLWRGNNGGATARGVTASTITLVFRKQKDVDAQEAEDPQIRDLQAFIDLFNKNYELYGRKVALKVFTGQATATGEFANQSQAQTQADAQTAYDLKAFAEIAPGVGDIGSWAAALAQKKIAALSMGLASQHVLDRDSPYAYANTVWHTAENWGHAAAGVACSRMRGMPATFSGDPVYRRTNRVFGLVKANDDNWGPAGDVFQSDSKKRCNLAIAQKSTYSPDVASGPQEAVSIVTQLKAAHVTTVITAADAITQGYLMQAADQQQYNPEWVVWETAGYQHTVQSKNQKSMIELGVLGPDVRKDKQESWHVYQVARPGHTPESQSSASILPLDYTFYSVANFFRAVQNAGPNLTPATLQAGWFAPQETLGPRGLFKFGPHSQSVNADFVISLYDPAIKDEYDGKAGDFRVCNRGTRYRFDRLATLGSGQLACQVGG